MTFTVCAEAKSPLEYHVSIGVCREAGCVGCLVDDAVAEFDVAESTRLKTARGVENRLKRELDRFVRECLDNGAMHLPLRRDDMSGTYRLDKKAYPLLSLALGPLVCLYAVDAVLGDMPDRIVLRALREGPGISLELLPEREGYYAVLDDEEVEKALDLPGLPGDGRRDTELFPSFYRMLQHMVDGDTMNICLEEF